MSIANATFHVLIPFFQAEEGVLRRCVQSVVEQSSPLHIHIIIVDDASPVPAEGEVQGLESENRSFTIVKRANGGAAAARNSALDSVPAGAVYVGFIDSDDSWDVDYVSAAVEAFSSGAEAFFSNSIRYTQESARFDWHPDPKLRLDGCGHRKLSDTYSIYLFEGDFFDYAVRRTNVVSSSALAYRFDRAGGLRFDQRFSHGEDRLFKLQLAQRLKRVAFSTRVLCHEGRGVNIFDSAGWGTEASRGLVSSYVAMTRHALDSLTLSIEQRRVLQQQLAAHRRAAVENSMHLAVRNPVAGVRYFGKSVLSDPGTLLSVPSVMLNKVRSTRSAR